MVAPMTGYVSLLRAVNVGGANRIAMADLREVYESLGLADVATYVQSGNVVFGAPKADPAKLTKEIEAALARRFGSAIATATRTAAELKSIIAANPFAKEAAADPTKVVVIFLPGPPTAAEREKLAQPVAGPERVMAAGADVYIHYPNGQGRSKLKLPVRSTGTARNWRTVVTLAEMASAVEKR
jgi:uncharacterized protein (DUF1697 family)